MATLAGQTIASSYEQLLSLPNGGGNGANLVAITDGDAGTTFCISMTDASTGKAILAVDGSHANGTELQIDNSATDGDAFLSFQLGGTSKFTMGVDDGDSDKFKIGTTAIGTGTMFALDANSRISLSNNNVSGATNNTIFGKLSGDDLVSGGAYNCFFGENSGHAISTGVANTAVGFEALMTEDERNDSTAIGYQALKVQNGSEPRMANTAVGYIAGQAITTGLKNTMVGAFAGTTASTAQGSVCVGYNAGGSGDIDSTGTIAIGFSALGILSTGIQNVAIGWQSQSVNNTGNWNTSVGYASSKLLVAGSNANTSVGANALTNGNNDTTHDNSCFGSSSGTVITGGSQCTIIGADSNPSAAGGTNQTTLGYGVTGVANNSVTLGSTSVTDVYMSQDSGAVVHSGALVNGLTAVNVSTSTLAYDTHQIVRGKYVTVSADAQTITLPTVQIGAVFIIVNIATDGGALLTISPHSGDRFLTNIAGAGGTDDKDITNTKATQNQGDFVKLVGMSADGWAITEISGIWADES